MHIPCKLAGTNWGAMRKLAQEPMEKLTSTSWPSAFIISALSQVKTVHQALWIANQYGLKNLPGTKLTAERLPRS